MPCYGLLSELLEHAQPYPITLRGSAQLAIVCLFCKVMCYINAGTSEDFRDDINLFPAIAQGGIVSLRAACVSFRWPVGYL